MNVLNETFQKHLKLLYERLKLKEVSMNKFDYLSNIGSGDDVDEDQYLSQIWREIYDYKKFNKSATLNDCLKESPSFLDFIDALATSSVDISTLDFKMCPLKNDELTKVEKEKYNKIISSLEIKWNSTFKDGEDVETC